MFSSFPYGKHCLQCQRFCFQDAYYAYATRQGILTKIRACEHLQKFCEHEQASIHVIFASNSSKCQILRALSNWMGQFDTLNMLGVYEFKPRGHKKMRYLKETQFSAIEIKLSSLYRARYSSIASYSKLSTRNNSIS